MQQTSAYSKEFFGLHNIATFPLPFLSLSLPPFLSLPFPSLLFLFPLSSLTLEVGPL